MVFVPPHPARDASDRIAAADKSRGSHFLVLATTGPSEETLTVPCLADELSVFVLRCR